MRIVTTKQPGESEQLQIVEQDVPKPSVGELLIEVAAAAVNRTDIITRQTRVNPYLGVEVAGIVREINGDSSFKIGDRVMGLVNQGGYSEYAVMPSDRAMLIPDNLSFTDAAAIPEVFLTAYQTLYWLGELQTGSVVIHAGASGVGTAAIQLAKQLTDAKIIVTAGSAQKLALCQRLGADVGINYHDTDFSERILQETNGQGVDVILDFIGASYWQQNLKSIAVDGRWVLIGILGGRIVEQVDLFALLEKRVQLKGTLLTPRADSYKAALTKEFYTNVAPYLANGTIYPVVDTIFDLADVQTAHEYMEANKNSGKIVLRVKEV
ncbi:NAD(P)H-quinone oxidoreductase [Candidatus Enterococcus willemsii]|uniref:NADPH:quinone oxidoreductase n=1 Tax=Candidatus Enterococcus willemsii TaxID=1857215 RepID=A0ABQ6YZS2_9ENTE|nr:NAD(P)H-quinone oxidoreductase [Enterococcus sp. CU12B]KAF1304124.1 NADPH:quinone oxidoreductase [Enterococcus sp. CU12B]